MCHYTYCMLQVLCSIAFLFLFEQARAACVDLDVRQMKNLFFKATETVPVS